MPDETNDLPGDQQNDGPDVKKTDGQGMEQVSGPGAADANNNQSAEAAQPEEEPVGSHRTEPRTFRKMSAADFRKKPEPKPEPKPAPIPSSRPPTEQSVQPAQPAVQQRPPEPAPEPPRAPVQPIPEPRPEPTPEPPAPQRQFSQPEPAAAGPEPEQRWKPVYEEPERQQEEPVYRQQEPPRQEPPRQEEPRNQKPPRGNSDGVSIMDALKGMFSFFTILPINVSGKEIYASNKNTYLSPIVGLVIGIIASVIGMIFYEIRAWSLIPIAIIATVYILSKFLHFDGLVDFGDGMIASGDQEKCTRALKDTNIGAGGLGVALIVVLATYAGLGALNGVYYFAFLISIVVVIMEVFVKNGMVAAAAFGEPGNGMASDQVRNTNFTTLMMSTGLSAGLAFVGYLIMGLVGSLVIVHGLWDSHIMISAILIIIGAAVVSIAVGWLVAVLANKKFGFVNGDCLGAANEISRVAILIVAILVVGFYL